MKSSGGMLWRRQSPAMTALCMLLCACSLGRPATVDAPSAFDGPPQIHIAAPLPGQSFLAGATVIVQARISNAGPDLARVLVLLDGETLGETAQPNPSGAGILPLTLEWLANTAGEYEIAVIAERGDGQSASESVALRVVSDSTPTQVAPVTAAGPQDSLPASVIKPANLRAGPGAEYELVANLAPGQTVEIIAMNQDGDWYQLRHGDGGAWVYADMIEPPHDLSRLRVEADNATPAVSDGWVNLVIDAVLIQPDPLVCGEPGNLTVAIRNEGNSDSLSGGFVEIQDSVPGAAIDRPSFQQVFGPVPAGGVVESQGAPFNISGAPEVGHELRVTIDSGGMIAESNEDDNSRVISYTLARGGCP